MTLNELLIEIEAKVKPFYIKDDGLAYDDVHDWLHMKRVYGACEKMLALEPGANRGEVLVAALFHDTGRSRGVEADHALHSYEIGQEILPGFSEEFVKNNIDLKKALLMVKYHTIAHICPDKNIADSIEFNIFTDGDKIDMFGTIGVVRVAVGYGYNHKQAFDKTIDRLIKSARDDNFQFQSEAGKKIGQKYKDFLKKFIQDIESQRQEFEF